MSDPVRPGAVTRQQLYDRIRETSKDEVILEEMIRLGFWPSGEGKPEPAIELIQRRGDLVRELGELQRESTKLGDPKRALEEQRKVRMAQARARRVETKKRNAKARQDRANAWHARRQRDVLYLGEGVSAGLAQTQTDKPLQAGLPALADIAALATAMGMPLAELRFLSFARDVSTVSHYQRFSIAKKSGGQRLISAPMPRLKRAQYWVLDNILAKIAPHEAAHGFATGRSILTNARNHVGRDVVINLDLKDFFPTLDYRRVKGLFESLGYAEAVAIPLALLATEPHVDEIMLDGRRHFVADGPRLLPQGAPTSPAITNLICRKLDRRLSGLAKNLGFNYSRYADDFTFSASGPALRKIGTLMKAIKGIVEAEGFHIHPDKTRIMRSGTRQEVTGLTVNEAVRVPRDAMRRFRAVLHQVETAGPAGRKFGSGRDVIRSLLGFAQFVAMIDPVIGAPLKARALALAARHGVRVARPAGRALSFRRAAAAGQRPDSIRWTPRERPAPLPDPELAAIEAREQKEAARAAQAAAKESAARQSSVPPPGPSPWSTRSQPPPPPPGQPSTPRPAPANMSTRALMLVALLLFAVWAFFAAPGARGPVAFIVAAALYWIFRKK